MSNGELQIGVYDSENKFKSSFDAAHIAGSESLRGAPTELATYRSTLVREMVVASGVSNITTDGIRFILDGIREYRPPARLSTDDIRLFRNYLVEQDARLRKAIDPLAGVRRDGSVELIWKTEHSYKEADDWQKRLASQEWSEPLPPLPPEYKKPTGSRLLDTSPQTNPGFWHPDGTDPSDEAPPTIYGEVLSDAPAVMCVSDLHMSDGGRGDDFMTDHLTYRRIGSQTLAVGGPGGASKGALLGGALAFCRARITSILGANAKLDFVLNGDIIDLLELQGRGTRFWSGHGSFLAVCQGHRAQGKGDVYYLRGNHDWIIPPGPWTPGVEYQNASLKVLATHGDAGDPFNSPPGTTSFGSRLVINAEAGVEAHGSNLLAGIDNLPPPHHVESMLNFLARRFSLFPSYDAASTALGSFFDGLSGLAAAAGGGAGVVIASFMQKFKADWQLQVAEAQASGYLNWGLTAVEGDSAYAGELQNRNIGGLSRFLDWIVVLGHTHVPVTRPGFYYNTGCWGPAVNSVHKPNEEYIMEMYPFFLRYAAPDGTLVEEYYTVRRRGSGYQIVFTPNCAAVRAGMGLPAGP